MRIAQVLGIAIVAGGTLSAAQAATSIDNLELLTAQNKYRAELGLPPLRWSQSVALTAQQWAMHLAQINRMQHSGVVGRGENLAMWTAGKASLTELVDLWGLERDYFVPAAFPAVSRTGDWKTVAHYTQLIWKQTTDVGCGIATGGGNDFLVCQYSPQGNIFGERAY